MTIFEKAQVYYPNLWNRKRIEMLVAANKLTEEEASSLFKNEEIQEGD